MALRIEERAILWEYLLCVQLSTSVYTRRNKSENNRFEQSWDLEVDVSVDCNIIPLQYVVKGTRAVVIQSLEYKSIRVTKKGKGNG
jgi:hypothetical protein